LLHWKTLQPYQLSMIFFFSSFLDFPVSNSEFEDHKLGFKWEHYSVKVREG